ncbi:putative quinol monooxygenase [Sphingomonas bacterium]|uniref:putative quinol monooxygenase n=1 Tax=Sphingomonas bacterium TaxID=1895847 RepID=UPI00157549D6|nr:putative quinol monooxygenase [Sphingomonas bacterium]
MTDTPGLLGYTIYRLATDDVDAFQSLALRMATMAKARDGCSFLDVARDASDPATFRLIEGWRDQAALDAHGASDEFQAVMKEAAALKIVGRSIDIYSVAGKQAVDMPS